MQESQLVMFRDSCRCAQPSLHYYVLEPEDTSINLHLQELSNLSLLNSLHPGKIFI